MAANPFHAVPRETLPQCKCGRGPVRSATQRNCRKCHAEAQKRYRQRNPRMPRRDLEALEALAAKHLHRNAE